MNGTEVLKERYALVMDRIREIPGEHAGEDEPGRFFRFCAEFLLLIDDTASFLEKGGLKTASMEELERKNQALYADVLPKHYGESYANPAYAVKQLGEELGPVLCFLYAELRSLICFAYEGRLEELVIRMELFMEVYTTFAYAADERGERPSEKEIREILYWFVSDYADIAAERRIKEQMDAQDCFAERMILGSDLSDVRYLYGYGEYVSENELETARFLAGLPQETIAAMADAYTEGYRRGFEVMGVDLGKKHTVSLHYQIGFERMMRRAIENFAKMGLKPVIYRAAFSVLDNKGAVRAKKNGFYGGTPNGQFDYDHRDDKALFLDRNYVNRRLEVTRTAYEKYRAEASEYAGPAVVMTFGEKDFCPITKRESLALSQDQNRLWVEYRSRAGQLQQEYIPEEETGFTMIAFPVPEIGPIFRELFEETIRKIREGRFVLPGREELNRAFEQENIERNS